MEDEVRVEPFNFKRRKTGKRGTGNTLRHRRDYSPIPLYLVEWEVKRLKQLRRLRKLERDCYEAALRVREVVDFKHLTEKDKEGDKTCKCGAGNSRFSRYCWNCQRKL